MKNTTKNITQNTDDLSKYVNIINTDMNDKIKGWRDQYNTLDQKEKKITNEAEQQKSLQAAKDFAIREEDDQVKKQKLTSDNSEKINTLFIKLQDQSIPASDIIEEFNLLSII